MKKVKTFKYLFQILVKLEYKLLDDQRIKINVDIELDLLQPYYLNTTPLCFLN